MKKLFFMLIELFKFEAEITEASLYKSGKFLTMTVQIDNETYNIQISKDENDGNQNN